MVDRDSIESLEAKLCEFEQEIDKLKQQQRVEDSLQNDLTGTFVEHVRESVYVPSAVNVEFTERNLPKYSGGGAILIGLWEHQDIDLEIELWASPEYENGGFFSALETDLDVFSLDSSHGHGLTETIGEIEGIMYMLKVLSLDDIVKAEDTSLS